MYTLTFQYESSGTPDWALEVRVMSALGRRHELYKQGSGMDIETLWRDIAWQPPSRKVALEMQKTILDACIRTPRSIEVGIRRL